MYRAICSLYDKEIQSTYIIYVLWIFLLYNEQIAKSINECFKGEMQLHVTEQLVVVYVYYCIINCQVSTAGIN